MAEHPWWAKLDLWAGFRDFDGVERACFMSLFRQSYAIEVLLIDPEEVSRMDREGELDSFIEGCEPEQSLLWLALLTM